MSKPAARLLDMHVCPMITVLVPHVGGPIAGPGAPTTLIAGLPAARVTDMCVRRSTRCDRAGIVHRADRRNAGGAGWRSHGAWRDDPSAGMSDGPHRRFGRRRWQPAGGDDGRRQGARRGVHAYGLCG